jgi:hypothetical protein
MVSRRPPPYDTTDDLVQDATMTTPALKAEARDLNFYYGASMPSRASTCRSTTRRSPP